MIKVIFEDNHLLVVEKPFNIPMQEDNTKDEDMLTLLKKYLKEKYQKPGNVYLGLVHRLDRPTGGICVFAKTSKAASRLSDQIRLNKIKKQYIAIVEDYKLKDEDTYIDYLLKNNQTNISYVNKDGKYAELSYQVLARKDNLAKVLVDLKTGRSHQIRVQFSSRKQPLFGDQKYNHNAEKKQLALWAYKLSFLHPTTKEELNFIAPTPDYYPFNIGGHHGE